MSAGADWDATFERALRMGDVLAASDLLRKAGENGYVKHAEFARAAGIVDAVRPAPLVRRDWATRLLSHPRRVDKELAARILVPLVVSHPRDVQRAVVRLARDDDWIVRESAASLFGAALVADFAAHLPAAREWLAGGESRVRRAAIVAAKYAARTRRPEWALPLLDLLEPALADRDEYVRKSLGPFAIGEQLLRSYPDETLQRLAVWAKHPNEVVRWNTAMAFSAASAARYLDRVMPILTPLLDDTSPAVRRAAGAALRRLRRRTGGEPAPTRSAVA